MSRSAPIHRPVGAVKNKMQVSLHGLRSSNELAMSDSPELRRGDKLMSPVDVRELLGTGYCGRLATVGSDGSPYICPLLYVVMQDEIWLHNTSAIGHLRTNISHEPRVCFEVDIAGTVFPYGRFECDTSIEYRSIVVFGQI